MMKYNTCLYICHSDDDECELGSDGCDDTATCVNLVPGYECQCDTGYISDTSSNGCIGTNYISK